MGVCITECVMATETLEGSYSSLSPGFFICEMNFRALLRVAALLSGRQGLSSSFHYSQGLAFQKLNVSWGRALSNETSLLKVDF